MIQIDDSGSGSFVGGTCIGIYRPETNEYYFDVIPVEFYNKDKFKKKLYLDEVIYIIREAFLNLSVNKNETIEICRGYMFENLKKWLTDEGYHYYCTHITGRVQEVVERNFELYTICIGLPEHYIKYTRYPFHFHKLLRWVYADFDNRINLCKVGWKSWQKIEDRKPDISFQNIDTSNYICLKCSNRIYKGSCIKVIKYNSNRENYIYLHDYC